jgi:hypothetical protein
MCTKDLSGKIKSVKRDKQRKGQFIGGKPAYGYKTHPTEKNKIVVDEKTRPTVRRIFSMALSGQSCRQIAAQLSVEKARELFTQYPEPEKLLPAAKAAVERANQADSLSAELAAVQSRINALTANLDKMYLDRLDGLFWQRRIFSASMIG